MTTTWQECDDCAHRLDERDAAVRCPHCAGLLSVHHAPVLTGNALREHFATSPSPSGVWRFGAVVMPDAGADMVSHPEGNTPLIERQQLARWADVTRLQFKHEGHNPTGSFKDRGMTVAMTQARRVGASAVACASTGNTSASLAAYAAQAGLPALAIIPEGQIALGKLAQTLAYGARTVMIDGDFDDCLRLMDAVSAELGVYLVNSVNPWRIEGQKTIGLDLLRQRQWQSPDWIVLPAGNLGNTAALGKAIDEAMTWGLITRRPRIVAVQAEGAAPFADAFARGFDRLVPAEAHTIATAIKIGAPASYARGVRAIRSTDGLVVSVSDREILEAKVAIDAAGVGCEPASAATLAAIRKLRRAGTIAEDDDIVAILTGHLLKDPTIVTELHGSDSTVPGLANRPVRIANTLDAVAAVLFPAQ
ncbi:MAG TPA: threonine synthase [Gemmatimonadales bacterium]|jgi:threonine synthase